MSQGQMPIERQIQAAEDNLGRLLDWVGRHDNKSSAILGLDTAMIGSLAVVARVLTSPIASISAIIAIGILGASFASIFLGAYPRLKGPVDSLLYFDSIARKKLDAYRAAFVNQTEQEYLSDLLAQCYRNSEIVSRKFWCLKWATRFVILAVVPWALALYLS